MFSRYVVNALPTSTLTQRGLFFLLYQYCYPRYICCYCRMVVMLAQARAILILTYHLNKKNIENYWRRLNGRDHHRLEACIPSSTIWCHRTCTMVLFNIFNMGITIPGKDGTYIKTGPRILGGLVWSDLQENGSLARHFVRLYLYR